MSSLPKKLLVCNRGEIAIRVFRSATELGIGTVGIYSFEDRFSLHRYKADEAYQVGEQGSPVRAYLDVSEVIRVAKESGCEAIHPGYGFLSERVELAEAAAEAGMTFVGPSVETLRIAGDKVATRALAAKEGVPTVPGTEALETEEALFRAAETIGYPLILKASFGGGGRGMRIVENEHALRSAYELARSEAQAAFGQPTVFVEKYLAAPKHIEVQLLGDGTGRVIHLFERDCSVQRRHQKVIEFAPSQSLAPAVVEKIYGYALALGSALKLKAAATAEFLVAPDGSVYFIEMNPRIQVEHTVTEEVTGIDIVASQIRIASDFCLEDLGLLQEKVSTRGVAIQVRITTENPEEDFAPDYGRIVTYRSASGFGIRLDAGSAFAGAEVVPYYDSMLVKVTARGNSMEEVTRRLIRSLREFRIRGVKTNIGFLKNLLQHPTFIAGNATTGFLEECPELFHVQKSRDRANRLLTFLAEVTVNGHEWLDGKASETPSPVVPDLEGLEPQDGWRQKLLELGPKKFCEVVREEKRQLITDTSLRDAHQSLLATRMRSFDMLRIAPAYARLMPELFSMEVWGGATFDVALRFLREDPWERLMRLREAVPNILFQMLLRGTNAVGYSSYPDNVIQSFVREARAAGIDIFRIFDCFNNLDRMRVSIDAAKQEGAIAEVCLCFTGDLLSEEASEAKKFGFDYYRRLARSLVEAGADIIAIKDMAGLLKPGAAGQLVKVLREEVEAPVHFHTHDTAGVQTAAYLDASRHGVDIVDCALSALSGATSQPPLEGFAAALQGSDRDTGIQVRQATSLSVYFESVRKAYAPFESDLKTSTSEVYENEIPGGQYSNFRPQANSLGLGDKWGELKRNYAAVNALLGGIIKVTPSSKVVGDMALFMTANELTPESLYQRAAELDFPASVVDFFKGEIGEPTGGFPEELRRRVLRGQKTVERQGKDRLPPADFKTTRGLVSNILKRDASTQEVLSYFMYPMVFKGFAEARERFGDVSVLPTPAFFYGLKEEEELIVDLEPGKRLFVSLVAISEPQDNGERTVFFELNGQPRSFQVLDKTAVPDLEPKEKADEGNDKQVGAPLAGILVSLDVEEGRNVRKDDPLFTVEAMKMQTVVRATRPGRIKRGLLGPGTKVEAGDLVVELE